MLQHEYKKPMRDIQISLDKEDKDGVLDLHKSLLGKTGMFGYYYGSPLYHKVEAFINA